MAQIIHDTPSLYSSRGFLKQITVKKFKHIKVEMVSVLKPHMLAHHPTSTAISPWPILP